MTSPWLARSARGVAGTRFWSLTVCD